MDEGGVQLNSYNFFSSGELHFIDQALAVEIAQVLVVIAGCSHPG